MDSEAWERAQLLFEKALARPVEARSAFIASACGAEVELRDEILSLLTVYERRGKVDLVPAAWLASLAERATSRFAAGEGVAGRYLIKGLLGSGGMGEVYEAWDEELSIPVALKTLHFAGGADRALHDLKLEGLLARSVWHPNVCRVYDLGRHGEGKDTTWFLTMELLRGETLEERLHDKGRPPIDRVLGFAEQMASGLGAAHRAGVVHRDFKTSNVMLVHKDDDEQAVVTDFGTARAASLAAQEKDREGAGPIIGTPAYMAPEQMRREEVGPAADIYALGIVLYEMVTGELPFTGSSATQAARRRLVEEAPSPRSIVPELDERWEAVIRRCLEREPRRRFARAEEVIEALAGRVATEKIESLEIPGRRRDTLPVERDAFVGRDAEIEELGRNLRDSSRLLTLLGAGGMGKTRLAIRYGWKSLGDWPGGVWFCDLTETRTVNGIAASVAGSLGVQLGRGDPLAQLGRVIAGRGRCLLILDNFEQVVGHAEETVGRWLDVALEARFVVTSRERLSLRGETVQEVKPLSIETGIELFTARARGLRPALDLRGSEADAAREIVRLVDGMPLAIELAAARMRVMSAAQIVAQMRKRFQLLTGGGSARHETLAVTIDGSWELLSPWEKSAWAQCSVFEGGFTLEAAEAVLDTSSWPLAPWVVDIVQSLVEKSLLRTWVPAVGTSALAPALRFGMYVSLQEYARMKLREERGAVEETLTDAEGAAEERHGKWYARYGSDEWIEALGRHGGVQRRRHLEQEMENLGAACRRALERGDEATSAAAYRASWAVLELRGPFANAVDVGRRILADPRLRPEERAKTLRALGQAERLSGRMEDARARFEEAIAIHRETGNRRLEAIVLGNMGNLLQEQGRVGEAGALYETALAFARDTGDRGFEGNMLSNLANLRVAQGRTEEALTDLENGLAIHREQGNRRFEGFVLSTLGSICLDQGRMSEARDHLEAALIIHREVGNRRFECIVLTTLGDVLFEQRHIDQARVCYEEALTIAREIGFRNHEGIALTDLGLLLHARGRFEEAQAHYESALAIHREIHGEGGNRRFEGDILSKLADLYHDQGRIADAQESVMKAEQILRSLQDPIGIGELLCIRAKIEHSIGNDPAARTALAEAEAIAVHAGCNSSSKLGRMIGELRQAVTVEK